MRFFIRWICSSCIALAVVGVGGFLCTFGGLYYFGRGLPDHNSLAKYNPSVSSTVFLHDGKLLKEFSLEKRSFIAIEHVPERLKNAFLAAEDSGFYEHCGIAPLSILRSLVRNFTNAGSSKRPQGASTITQQVARIFLIGSNELKYERKIKEAILAFRIENSLSKQKILELYLNQIYLGAGTYGVAAAAKTYFGKSVKELTNAECAMLAALAKGASYYCPINHKERALERRNWVLGRMLEGGFITTQECKEARESDINLMVSGDDNRADYYAEEVRKEIHNKCNIASVNKDGLVIRVPIDISMQKAAEQALKEGLERIDRAKGWHGVIKNIPYKSNELAIKALQNMQLPPGGEDFELAMILRGNKGTSCLLSDGQTFAVSGSDMNWLGTGKKAVKTGDIVLCQRDKNGKKISLKQIPEVQGAIVAMDPHTGKILAMQGGYSFNQSKFNRVTQANRQPGSVFKPIVYLTALNSGFTPASIIDGSPISIMVGDTLWEPHNFKNEIVGDTTLRTGIERSLNTVTVKIAQDVGISNISIMSEKLGVYDRAPRLWSIVLGSVETTLLRLVNAYCIIANGGKRVSPVLIDQIQDKTGKTIYRSEQVPVDTISQISHNLTYPPKFQINQQQVLDERSTYQLISLLMGSVNSGTSRGAKQLGIPLAGKTGTSNDSRDNWFIGFTPNLVVGVLVCYDANGRSLGERATGASNALPIFVRFMRLAKKDKDKVPFKVPSGITFQHIDKQSGVKCKSSDPGAFLEAFKTDDHVDEIIIKSSPKEEESGSIFYESDDVGTLREITVDTDSDPLSGIY